MKISDIGEFGFIEKIVSQFPQNLPKNTIGIGDDCAVFPVNEETSLLVTTDMLQEYVHFFPTISPEMLGRKALAVNLSDIAAMGGKPHSAYLSLALPKSISTAWLDKFMLGFSRLCHQTHTLLLGGDTTGSPENIVINITIIGTAESDKIKLRSTALPGDIICVNNYLGDSAFGLMLLENNLDWKKKQETRDLVRLHNFPKIFLKEGSWLAQQPSVHALMDISDGLDSDIKHILKQSSVGAKIELSKLPVSENMQKVSSLLNWNSQELAAKGGEDYCLLFTVAPDEFENVADLYFKEFKSKIHPIGEITSGIDLSYFRGSESVKLAGKGFEHF